MRITNATLTVAKSDSRSWLERVGRELSAHLRAGRYPLRAAIATEAEYRAFVGSRRKMQSLREKLVAQGIDAAAIDRVKAPAGLDLGAITPEEIAMSILAEITVERRRGQRAAPAI